MQNTTNYNLKKPDYTDFADIADINDNMDTIDAQLAAPTGDSADSTTTFTTSDTADGGASSWTNVPALTSGETHKSLFAKMSQMFKNIRYLYKMLGTTDISSIGNGTVTGGISSLNDSFKATKRYVRELALTGAVLNISTAGKAYLHIPVAFRYALVMCRMVTHDDKARYFTAICYTNYTSLNEIVVLNKETNVGDIIFTIGSSTNLPVFIVSLPEYASTTLRSCEITLLIRGMQD